MVDCSERNMADAIRNQGIRMSMEYHIHTWVSLEKLIVNESFDGPRRDARVHRLSVAYTVLANVVAPGD